jgi:hypothetical protein
MGQFYGLGEKKSWRIRLANDGHVATQAHAPQAAILFDKFHVIAPSRLGSG